MATITISRQFGSHGDTVAQLVAERLGYRYFDKGMMIGLAVQSGIPYKEALKLPDEQKQARSLLEILFVSYSPILGAPGATAAGFVAEAHSRQTAERVAHLIEAAYAQGNVVIVGRGGQAVLRDKADVLHVRIIAPLQLRIERHGRRAGLDPVEARKAVIERDKASIDYVQHYYEIDPTDPIFYDLIIGTGKLTPSAAADLIIQAVSRPPFSSSVPG